MGLTAGTPIDRGQDRPVFIGSCTNGRIEDLRAAAAVAKGRKVADGVNAMVVPGSGLVKEQAEEEGLDEIFNDAGFEWREPGCSMCLAMNPDKLSPGERCASTSNRNFEGRQGRGGRTHLVSPPWPPPPRSPATSPTSANWPEENPETWKSSPPSTGVAAPLPLVNVDTDMIIPKQFLKTIKRTGLGKHLFDEMRYDAGRQREARTSC